MRAEVSFYEIELKDMLWFLNGTKEEDMRQMEDSLSLLVCHEVRKEVSHCEFNLSVAVSPT